LLIDDLLLVLLVSVYERTTLLKAHVSSLVKSKLNLKPE